jgi:hypothetical protein
VNVSAPALASLVAFITVIKSGSITGKARTGYKVPLVFALDIIAAIIVEADTIPIFPSRIIIINAEKFFISKLVIKTNNIKIKILIKKVSTRLNNNFPIKILIGSTLSLRAKDVSFSSSLINTRASPLIAAKKITIQSRPERISPSTFSSPIENLIMDIVTSTNIKSELITYLFLSSDLKSFLNIFTDVLNKLKIIYANLIFIN